MTLSTIAAVLMWVIVLAGFLPVAFRATKKVADKRDPGFWMSLEYYGTLIGGVIVGLALLWIFYTVQNLGASAAPGFEVVVPLYLIGRQVIAWLPRSSKWDAWRDPFMFWRKTA